MIQDGSSKKERDGKLTLFCSHLARQLSGLRGVFIAELVQRGQTRGVVKKV